MRLKISIDPEEGDDADSLKNLSFKIAMMILSTETWQAGAEAIRDIGFTGSHEACLSSGQSVDRKVFIEVEFRKFK